MLAEAAFGGPGAVTHDARNRGWIVRRGLLTADAGSTLAVGGERAFEGTDGRAVGEGVRVDQLPELLEETGLQLVVRRAKIEERDRNCESRVSKHAQTVAAAAGGHHTTSA